MNLIAISLKVSLQVSNSKEAQSKGNACDWHDVVNDVTQGLGKLKFSTLVNLATGLNRTHFVYLKIKECISS